MKEFVREYDPDRARAIETLRHHGIAVSDVALATLNAEDSREYPSSAMEMLEWLRRSPDWLTSKR
jgi:hypothetical protein